MMTRVCFGLSLVALAMACGLGWTANGQDGKKGIAVDPDWEVVAFYKKNKAAVDESYEKLVTILSAPTFKNLPAAEQKERRRQFTAVSGILTVAARQVPLTDQERFELMVLRKSHFSGEPMTPHELAHLARLSYHLQIENQARTEALLLAMQKKGGPSGPPPLGPYEKKLALQKEQEKEMGAPPKVFDPPPSSQKKLDDHAGGTPKYYAPPGGPLPPSVKGVSVQEDIASYHDAWLRASVLVVRNLSKAWSSGVGGYVGAPSTKGGDPLSRWNTEDEIWREFERIDFLFESLRARGVSVAEIYGFRVPEPPQLAK